MDAKYVDLPGFPDFEPTAPGHLLAHPSMMTGPEKALLHHIADKHYAGTGVIIDAGLFLGASTNIFGHALRSRGFFGKRIYSYDLAIFFKTMDKYLERDDVRALFDGWTPKAGDSLVPLLRRVLAQYDDLTLFHFGDLAETAALDRPAEIAFFDCLKSPRAERAVARAFLPRLQPGAIVIQQDYFYYEAPEHRVRQEFLSRHFDYLGQINTAAYFRLKHALPENDLAIEPSTELSIGSQLELIEQAALRSRFVGWAWQARLSGAFLIRHLVGPEAALDHLERLRADLPAKINTRLWDKYRLLWSQHARLGKGPSAPPSP